MPTGKHYHLKNGVNSPCVWGFWRNRYVLSTLPFFLVSCCTQEYSFLSVSLPLQIEITAPVSHLIKQLSDNYRL
ncbi:hypothetical protein AVEN_132456-1, partial [Araneus ventricosus]